MILHKKNHVENEMIISMDKLLSIQIFTVDINSNKWIVNLNLHIVFDEYILKIKRHVFKHLC